MNTCVGNGKCGKTRGREGGGAGTVVFCAAALLFSAVLLAFPEISSEAVGRTVTFCVRRLIPAVFPFAVISGLLLGMGFPEVCRRAFGNFFQKLFALPSAGAAAFFLGLFSGLPTGGKGVLTLCGDDLIGREDAEALLPVCNFPGPAFLCAAVGHGLWGSGAFGAALWGVTVLSTLTAHRLLVANRPHVVHKLRVAHRPPAAHRLRTVDRPLVEDRPLTRPGVGNDSGVRNSDGVNRTDATDISSSHGTSSYGASANAIIEHRSHKTDTCHPYDTSSYGKKCERTHPEIGFAPVSPKKSFAETFAESVSGAALATVTICGSILTSEVFLSFCGHILSVAGAGETPLVFVSAISELSAGTAALRGGSLSGTLDVMLARTLTFGVCAFGGVSAHLQTAALAYPAGVGMKRYFAVKLTAALIALPLGLLVSVLFSRLH